MALEEGITNKTKIHNLRLIFTIDVFLITSLGILFGIKAGQVDNALVGETCRSENK